MNSIATTAAVPLMKVVGSIQREDVRGPRINGERLQQDRAAVAEFIDVLFRYAGPHTYISVRAFHEANDKARPLLLNWVPAGASAVDLLCQYISRAANHEEPYVFCPPVATFASPKNAATGNLAEGIVLSVECDKAPEAARRKLMALLGPPTAEVKSGGVWENPETSELEHKVHLHWRLKEPTRVPGDHARLREARALAATLVGGDASAKPLVHPLRWPGSWHRKGEPRLVRLETTPDAEIELMDALEKLRNACPQQQERPSNKPLEDLQVADPLDIAAALAVIPNPDVGWDEWNSKIAMAAWRASGGRAFPAFDAWSQKSPKYNAKNTRNRWDHITKYPPDRIGAGTLFYLAKQARPDWHKPSARERPSRRPEEALHSWNDPDWSILDDSRGDLPPFPVDVFSQPIKEWLEHTAHGAGATVDHVAIPVLGTVSSLIGTARRIAASRSFVQPVACWMAVVGESGTGKTPGLKVSLLAMTAVAQLPTFRKLLSDLKSNHDKGVARATAELKKWNDAVKQAAEKGDDTPDKPKLAEHPGRYVAPKLFISDITVEQIAVRLQLWPGRLLVVRDELAGVFLNMSRYANGGRDNEFWLEAWNGLPYSADRKTSEAVYAPYLMVGILGGFQPDKMVRSFRGDDDGMYTRVLFAWPEEAPYRELTNEVDENEPELINAFNRIVNLVTKGKQQVVVGETLVDEEIAFVPRRIFLSPEAVAEFEEFRKFVHRERKALWGRESEWLAKGPLHVLRLAGAIAFLEWAWIGGEEPKEVGRGVVAAAVKLVREYFWPHSRAALRRAGISQRHNDERAVLVWARARGKEEVSREDVRQNALSKRLDAEQTQRLLDGLVKAGWLRQVVDPPGPKGGKPAYRWLINPVLISAPETPITPETYNNG